MQILILVTSQATLHLLDGEIHPSGLWAEEFVVPYKRFREEGYTIDIAAIGGIFPTVNKTSIDPNFTQYVRPLGSQEDDVARSQADGKLHSFLELVIEVLSLGSENERRDRELKLKLYSRRNAKESWIVNWQELTLEVYRREDADSKDGLQPS